MILPLLVLCVASASPGTGEVAVASRSVSLQFRGAAVVGLVNRLTGESYVEERSSPASRWGLHALKEHLPASTAAAAALSRAGTGQRRVTLVALRWPGKGQLATRLAVDTASGEVTLSQSATSTQAGLYGSSWGVAFVPERFEILVPGNSGQRFGKDAPYEKRVFEYPMGWEAAFVLIQGPRGGVIIQSADTTLGPKVLTVHRVVGGFLLSFESRNEAPFETRKAVNGQPWLVKAYKGPWQVGAQMYRQWAARAYSLRPLASRRPAWAAGIRLVAIVGMDIETIRTLARHVRPHQTLLYVPGWRRDGYDRNYPDYTPAPEFGPFVAEAHRLGFRVMPHVNYFGCDPKNPEYERFRRYHMRDPFSRELLWWDWKLADPPIKFAYINPASREWRRLFVERMRTLCRRYDIDALHLDQTLGIFNDANGRIDGMSCAEGNLALHRELKHAMPDVALSGEGLNEVTCRHEEFAQRHVYSLDHVHMTWSDRHLGMAHPIASAVLLPYTTMYGHLGMANPWNAPDLHDVYVRAYERYGVIPTYAWPSATELTEPKPWPITMLLRRAGLFLSYAPVPDFSPNWQPGELFVWNLQGGGRMRYVRENGVALEARLPGRSTYEVMERRVEGARVLRGGGTITGWLAYDGKAILGLDPGRRYRWSPEPPDMNAPHLEAVPQGWHIVRSGRHEDLLRVELARTENGGLPIRLWEEARRARAGCVAPGGRAPVVPGIDYADDVSGGAVHLDGEGLFMHPPWKGLPAAKEERAGFVTFVEYRLTLPDLPGLRMEAGAQVRSGAGETDGVRFRCLAWPAERRGQRFQAETIAVPGEERRLSLDLSPLRSKKITLRLEADAGPRGDPTFDWGRLHQPRIVGDPAAGPAVKSELLLGGSRTPRAVLTAMGDASWLKRPDGRILVSLGLPNTLTAVFGEPAAVSAIQSSGEGVLLRLADLPFRVRTRSGDGMEGGPPHYGPRIGPAVCAGQERSAIHEHPPQRGCTLLDYHLQLPPSPCKFVTSIGVRDGSTSTGVGFRVELNGAVCFSRDLRPNSGWLPVEVDLSNWAGKEIVLTLVTDSLGGFECDWAVWADPRLEIR